MLDSAINIILLIDAIPIIDDIKMTWKRQHAVMLINDVYRAIDESMKNIIKECNERYTRDKARLCTLDGTTGEYCCSISRCMDADFITISLIRHYVATHKFSPKSGIWRFKIPERSDHKHVLYISMSYTRIDDNAWTIFLQ